MSFSGDLLLTKVWNSWFISSRYLCPGSKRGFRLWSQSCALCSPEPEKGGQGGRREALSYRTYWLGLLGKRSGPGLPTDQAECGAGVFRSLEMLPVLPISNRWVGPGHGHVGSLSTSQRGLLSIPKALDSVWLGRGPGEMDTVVFSVSSALNSLQFCPHLRKAGSNCPAPG